MKSGSGNGSSCGDRSAGATCSSGALAQNQLPGGHLPAPEAGADCAAANAGTASTSARAPEETITFAMARDPSARNSG
jgi:hypothetical protein